MLSDPIVRFITPYSMFLLTCITVALEIFNPAMRKLYWTVREALTSQYPDLHWNFKHSAFSTTTLNFGPQTVCIPHADENDFVFGWGTLKSFGSFDYTKGGHVAFWDLGIMFQFPPGAEFFFPSARFIHGNTQLQEGETRYSMTSYSSGGLFEWVHRGGLPLYGWIQHLSRHVGLEEAEIAAEDSRNTAFLNTCFPVCD